MRAIICGANGAMGKLICDILGAEVVGKVSIDGENGVPRTFAALGTVEADMLIDFSHHTAVSDVLAYAKEHGLPTVIGTTGHTAGEKQLIFDAAKELPIFFSGNMSLGIAVLCRLAKQAAACFPDADIEIVEAHHNRKVDAPSGTAKQLLQAIDPEGTALVVHGREGMCGKREENEIGVFSLRGGTVAGEHTVCFFGEDECLEFTHKAQSRRVFAAGAVRAAEALADKPAGFYTLEELIF